VPDLEATKERLARACRVAGKLNLADEAGHISVRLPSSEQILIKARGPGEVGVRFTDVRDIITVDLEGRKLEGADDLNVPNEVFIHTCIYQARAEIQSVVHMHPPSVVLFTICDLPLLPLYGAFDPPSLALALDGIPTFDRSVLVSDEELGNQLVEAMQGQPACLMRGHGIATAGGSVEQATLTAIALNRLAEMNERAHRLGAPRPISDQDQDVFRRFRSRTHPGAEVSTHQPAAAGSSRLAVSWRYYCRLVGED